MSHTTEPWTATNSTIRNSNGRVVIAYLYSKRTRAANIEAQAAAITRDGARAAMLEVRRRAARGQVLNRVAA